MNRNNADGLSPALCPVFGKTVEQFFEAYLEAKNNLIPTKNHAITSKQMTSGIFQTVFEKLKSCLMCRRLVNYCTILCPKFEEQVVTLSWKINNQLGEPVWIKSHCWISMFCVVVHNPSCRSRKLNFSFQVCNISNNKREENSTGENIVKMTKPDINTVWN